MIILSKLQKPQIKTKTLRRERLLALLSANLDKKVILLSAGAGYGKTTLLSQFLSETNIPYIYYHLEKDDAEPALFFSYLVAGIRKIEPEFGKRLERLRSVFNYPQRFTEIIVGTFINELVEHIHENLLITLEDYHALEPSEPLDQILNYLLVHQPQHLHLIITSRTIPSLPFDHLRVKNEIFELNTQHLRFTRDEIRELFEKTFGLSLKESEIAWLETHSEGWPTALRLISQSFERIDDIDYIKKIEEDYYQSKSTLFNYFTQEIYNKEPDELRQFLLDCSLFEWFTPELCDWVTKRKDSAKILSDLNAQNTFLFKIPGLGYRFHTLFRDFLQSKTKDINREKRIYRNAGDYFYKERELEQAVNFYLRAGEYSKSASTIEKIGNSLIEQGKSGIIYSFIEKVPNFIRNERPELLIHYAQSLIYSGRFDEARDNCLRAVRMLKKNLKRRKENADVLYKLGGISLNQGNFDAAKRWFKNALKVCPQSGYLTKASILNSLGSLFTAIGGKNLSEAQKYFAQAFEIANRHGYKELKASILNNWGTSEMKLGNLNQAYSKLSSMVATLRHHFSPGCGAGFYNASKVSLLLGYLKEARAILDLGQEICSGYNDEWSMAAVWRGNALLYEELGDLAKAKELISKALEIYEKLGILWLIINVRNEMAMIDITAGNLTEAERGLSIVWELKKNRVDAEAIPILLIEAKLRIAQTEYREARDILYEAQDGANKYNQVFHLFLIHLELSKVFHYQEENQRAITSLKETIAICHDRGYNYLLLKEFQKERWMLDCIKNEDIEKKYILSLIKKSGLDIHWCDVFFFGVPRILVDGCEIEDDVWKTLKAKKLFFYLLLHKNEKISQDSIIEALWRDSSPGAGKDSFRKAIQHIRETFTVIGVSTDDLIISSKGLYQISPQVSIWIDIDDFQNFIIQARNLKDQDKKLESCLERAISIYKNGFAVGWYDDWIEDVRNHYANLYEECLGMMASFYFRNKRFKEAALWYKMLILLNFYEEEYHRKLMTVWAKLGRYKNIKEDFEMLEKALGKELGTQPQEETVRLYKELVKI